MRLRFLAFVPLAIAAFSCVKPDAAATIAEPAASNEAYVIMPPTAVATPRLAEDRRALQARVLELIAAQGAKVVKLDELDPLSAPEPACRAPRTLADRVRARFGRAPEVRIDASCVQRPCTITLSIERPPEANGTAWETLDRFETHVDAPDSPADWIAALDKLGPGRATPGPVLDELRAVSPPTATAQSVASFGPLGDAAPRPTSFDFGSCFDDGLTQTRTDEVRLVVGNDGAASRCEVEETSAKLASPRAACLCTVARAVKFAPASAERRLDVTVTNDAHASVDLRGLRFAARLQSLRATDGGAIASQTQRASARLAACAAAAAITTPLTMHLRIDVDSVGMITRVAMDGTNDVLRACSGATLRATLLPCGRNGAYAIEGELVVWPEKI
ncbi:hypothetical protein BH09MYX1_BH09MYX1_20980 [soil metagenome]